MLPHAKVAEIRKLLAQGYLSQRQIARTLHVSRGIISSIATGKRPNYPVKVPEQEIDYSRPPIRCSGCGGLVHLPCKLCRVRELKARKQAKLKSCSQFIHRKSERLPECKLLKSA